MIAKMTTMKKIADAIAKAHILNHEAKFDFIMINEIDTSFMVVITHPLLPHSIEEVININKMPANVAEEYLHCRVHGMAAKLLAKLYPDKP